MAYKLKKISAKGRIDNIKSSINALFLGNVKTETDAELYAKVITGILDYYVGIVKGRKTMDNRWLWLMVMHLETKQRNQKRKKNVWNHQSHTLRRMWKTLSHRKLWK
jgi:hypothetical protein